MERLASLPTYCGWIYYFQDYNVCNLPIVPYQEYRYGEQQDVFDPIRCYFSWKKQRVCNREYHSHQRSMQKEKMEAEQVGLEYDELIMDVAEKVYMDHTYNMAWIDLKIEIDFTFERLN